MKTLFRNVFSSAKELKNPRALVVTSLMVAIGVVLHSFATIPISDMLMLKWAFLPMAVVGMMYGPIPATICGGLIDLISTLMMPKSGSGFIVGITLCVAASGFLYGIFLYKAEKITFRVIICTLVNFVVVTMLMTTAVLSFSFGWPFFQSLVPRFLKALLLPVEAVTLVLVLNALKKRLKNFHL